MTTGYSLVADFNPLAAAAAAAAVAVVANSKGSSNTSAGLATSYRPGTARRDIAGSC